MSKRNIEIEERLSNEILVDAYDDEEQIVSWYQYISDEMEFPFEASINVKDLSRKIKSKRIKVLGLYAESLDKMNIEIEIEIDDNIIEIPLGKLEEVFSTEKNIEIVNDWKYWYVR